MFWPFFVLIWKNEVSSQVTLSDCSVWGRQPRTSRAAQQFKQGWHVALQQFHTLLWCERYCPMLWAQPWKSQWPVVCLSRTTWTGHEWSFAYQEGNCETYIMDMDMLLKLRQELMGKKNHSHSSRYVLLLNVLSSKFTITSFLLCFISRKPSLKDASV